MATSPEIDDSHAGKRIYALIEELFPICRSITGQGVRDTLDIIERFIPLERSSFDTGAAIFDWEVPREWNISDAYIKDSTGRRIVDFHAHNLHVVNYSVPVRARMRLGELKAHLHTIPERPDWIPYRTSYYRDSWGFCLTQRQMDTLVDDDYEVCIESSLAPGTLTLAELVVPGAVTEEVLIYTHDCHPSLCNDNLSALAVTTLLAQKWRSTPHHYTYRFIFGPATIGSIAWLSRNEAHTSMIRHGLVLASLGDRGPFTYKRSRRGGAEIDRIVEYVLQRQGNGRCEDFSPYGYDERQFCSPGFNLPMGRLTRAPNGSYPEYHTSADNLDFITEPSLGESLRVCEQILDILDHNGCYLNLAPKCEPRLGKRGLFRVTGGSSPGEFEHALLWVLNQSDGDLDLLGIARKANLDFSLILRAALALVDAALLRRLE